MEWYWHIYWSVVAVWATYKITNRLMDIRNVFVEIENHKNGIQ